MITDYLFTSESVTEGHPDKVADQISDAILDAIIAQDKYARVACETLVKTGVAIVAGEITTTATIDYEKIIRQVILDIGYDSSDVFFDGRTCGVLNLIGQQSPDIAQGVDTGGAGDQGSSRPAVWVRVQPGQKDVSIEVNRPTIMRDAGRANKPQKKLEKAPKNAWIKQLT